MVLPFSDASLDEWAGTSDKEEMVKLGTEHIIKTAEVASRARDPDGLWILRIDRVGELVHLATAAPGDLRRRLGALRRALEPDPRPLQGARRPVCPRGPPTEIAYNVYTAEEAIKRLDRDDWGFNFDPSH